MQTILKYWWLFYLALWIGLTIAIWPLPLDRYLAVLVIVVVMVDLILTKERL